MIRDVEKFSKDALTQQLGNYSSYFEIGDSSFEAFIGEYLQTSDLANALMVLKIAELRKMFSEKPKRAEFALVLLEVMSLRNGLGFEY